MTHSQRSKARGVQDESGYNQGWSGGLSTEIRAERRCDLLISKMMPSASGKILEIGCGRGEIAHYLAARTGMRVLGVDRSERFVEEARSRSVDSGARFEAFDFMQAKEHFGDERFDYVVGNGILHHLYYNLAEALYAMRYLLVDGGRILFLEPNIHNPYIYLIFTRPRLRKLARLEPDEMAFSRGFALRQLQTTGFDDTDVEYRDFLVPGVPDWSIRPLISVGHIAEKAPGVKHLAQSLFISARSPGRPSL